MTRSTTSLHAAKILLSHFPLNHCRFYNADEHLNVLYDSLVKSSLDSEDVANMEKENFKNMHEIRQTLRNSKNAHKSYLWRTSVELVVSIILLVFFCGFNGIKGLNKPLFDCDVHGVLFKCVIPNSRFFHVSTIVLNHIHISIT